MTAAFGRRVGSILALPLLQASFLESFTERVKPEMRDQIFDNFISLQREGFTEDGINSVEKVEVMPNEGEQTNNSQYTNLTPTLASLPPKTPSA